MLRIGWIAARIFFVVAWAAAFGAMVNRAALDTDLLVKLPRTPTAERTAAMRLNRGQTVVFTNADDRARVARIDHWLRRTWLAAVVASVLVVVLYQLRARRRPAARG